MSGPAAGVVAAQAHAALHGYDRCLSMDMVDICSIVNGTPLKTTDADVRPYKLEIPIVDIRTIGAGGSSIAWIDSGDLQRVDP